MREALRYDHRLLLEFLVWHEPINDTKRKRLFGFDGIC